MSVYCIRSTCTKAVVRGGGGGGGGAWGGLSPPKILVQHIIYKRIHINIVVTN